MGQKVNPNGFRYGITKERNSQWISKDKKDFAKRLLEDQKIYAFFKKFNRKYLIGQLQILRNQSNDTLVKVYSAKPGEILGKGGENLKALNLELKKTLKNKDLKINIEVIEIEKPELNAFLIAQDIAIKLENRGSFRMIQKNVIKNAMKAGAKGIKTSVSGRLNGVDMARTEGYTEGEMKLHTLRQEIDFAMDNANTKYGIIGVKVWVSKGEKLAGGRNDVTTKKN